MSDFNKIYCDTDDGNLNYLHRLVRQASKREESEWAESVKYYEKRLEKLKAENQRMREALFRVVDAFTPEVVHIGSMHNKYRAAYEASVYDPIKQARDALKDEE